MHLELLVEEPSTEAALEILVPKIVKGKATHKVHVFQGKRDLLSNLPARLRGYAPWLPQDWRIVVLIDEDRQNCAQLKGELEKICRQAGLHSKSNPRSRGVFNVVNRLAIEELEAWYFGDIDALVSAYPRIPSTLGKRRGFRDPDGVKGGTWEALERELIKAGYHRGGLQKVRAAREIAPHMTQVVTVRTAFRSF